jgi:NAD(P)-dependent dehydrogenase (short-subunit alcohol dehydrogenase family)
MNEIFGLTDKVAIVWGGGQGMGESSALRLAEAGCDVAIVDIVAERAEQIAAKIRELGRRSMAFVADVTSEKQVEDTVAAAEAALGPIEVMVTVIGIAFFAPLIDVTLDQWDASLNLNLKSFFIPARAVARSLIHGKRPGAIVGIASVSGLTSAPNHGAYGAAKAGLVNLVRTMAVEWGSAGIRVNAISPGSISTPRIPKTPAMAERMKRMLPLQRPGTTDEIGKAALFLASDLASYVTGSTLLVDGGWMSTFLMDPRFENMPAA